MRYTTLVLAGALTLALGGPTARALAADPGLTATEVKIGNTNPYSGPASSYGTIGKAIAAYFRMVNDEGGINGRKLNFVSLDDGYAPPKTVEMARQLLEQEQVLFLFQTLGTPTNTAIWKYMNDQHVPHLFVATGATKWGDPKGHPWTMGWQPTYQAQAIRRAFDIGWKPTQFLNNVSASIGAALKPAGLEASKGVITALYLKDPDDPDWRDDPGMKAWRVWMQKYYPAGNLHDVNNVYGYSTAQTLVHVLRQCGPELSRATVMRQAANIKDLSLPLLLPGIKINTSPTDFCPIEQEQLARFDGGRWVP